MSTFFFRHGYHSWLSVRQLLWCPRKLVHAAPRAAQLLQLGCGCTSCLSAVSGHSGTSCYLLQLWEQAGPSETSLVSVAVDRISPVRLTR